MALLYIKVHFDIVVCTSGDHNSAVLLPQCHLNILSPCSTSL